MKWLGCCFLVLIANLQNERLIMNPQEPNPFGNNPFNTQDQLTKDIASMIQTNAQTAPDILPIELITAAENIRTKLSTMNLEFERTQLLKNTVSQISKENGGKVYSNTDMINFERKARQQG